MVLGGALGNILDRVRLGYVVDFADLHFGEFRPFLVFNVGDAAISIGVVILLLRAFLTRKDKAPKQGDYRTCVKPCRPSSWSLPPSRQRLRRIDGAVAGPDEFAVARNAPLVVPPDFSLAPPVAGTAGCRPSDAQQQAIDALFGGPAPRSAARDQPARRGRPRQRADRHPLDRLGPRHAHRRQGPDDADNSVGAAGGQQHRVRAGRAVSRSRGSET